MRSNLFRIVFLVSHITVMSCVRSQSKNERQKSPSIEIKHGSLGLNEQWNSYDDDEKAPLFSTESSSNVKSLPKQRKSKAGKPSRIRKPGYYSSTQVIDRKAKKIFQSQSGHGYSIEECKKKAMTEYREKKRLESQRKRERAKAMGKKLASYRKFGYDKREAAIGRKVVGLLGQENDIVTYTRARESAEKWYRDYQREKARNFRRKKKLKLQHEDEIHDQSHQDTSESV